MIMSLSNKIWHRAPVFLKGVNLMFTTHCTMLSPGGLLACRLSHFWQTVRIRWSSLWEIWSKTQYDFLFSFQTSKECFFGREYLFCNHQKFFQGFFGAHHTVFKWNMLMPQNAQRRHKNPCFSLWNIQGFSLRYSPTETTTVIYHYFLHCCTMYSTLKETTSQRRTKAKKINNSVVKEYQEIFLKIACILFALKCHVWFASLALP